LRNRFSDQTQNFLNQGVGAQRNSGDQTDQATQTKSSSEQEFNKKQSQRPNKRPNKQISTAQKLNILSTVLDEVQEADKQVVTDKESELNSATNLAQNQAASSVDSPSQEKTQIADNHSDQPVQINEPPQEQMISSGRKESLEGGSVSPESGGSLQYVEHEKTPEVPAEVEKYIKKVEDKKVRAPEEIVVANQASSVQDDQKYVSEPVVVLPITPEVEAQGKKKPPKFSVRWLVEWSHKIVKMFSGRAIYRQPANQ
jgi:hypothetical protein